MPPKKTTTKPTKTVKKPAKTVKKPTKTVKKPTKTVKKLFRVKNVSDGDILLAAGATGGLIGLGLLVASNLKKKRMEAREAKENDEIEKTVLERIKAKAAATKEKAVDELKKITETSTTIRDNAPPAPRTSTTIRDNAPPSPKVQPILQSSSKTEKIEEVVSNVKKSVEKFTREQKQEIANILSKGKDISEYISKITGRTFTPSSIKFSKEDPIKLRLHVIEGAARGFSDSDISRGLEKLRADDYDRKTVEKMNDILAKSNLLVQPVSKKFKFPTLRK